MKQTVPKVLKDGRVIETRINATPKMWEGVYLRFHYLNMCRNSQAHAAEISSRGKSKSYTIASLVSKMTTLGISDELSEKRATLVVASNKDYLIKKGQGVLEKFEHNWSFLRESTQFPSTLSQSSITNMA
jgi:hypothetical protein